MPRRYTKAIYLDFTTSPYNSATANISIPFKVRSIHCKSAGLDAAATPTNATYVTLSSDLSDNQPLTLLFNDSTYSYTAYSNIIIDLFTPKIINGNYTFNLTAIDGTPYDESNKVVLLLEFNEFIDEL